MYREILNRGNLYLIESFDCGDEGLNNYIKEQAIKDQENRLNTTSLVLSQYSKRVSLLGYYTLKNSAITYKASGKPVWFPAIELSFLAINRKYQHAGYGSKVLQKIIYRAINYGKDFSACTGIVLSALETSVNFYINNGFIDCTEIFEMTYDDCRKTTTSMFINLMES